MLSQHPISCCALQEPRRSSLDSGGRRRSLNLGRRSIGSLTSSRASAQEGWAVAAGGTDAPGGDPYRGLPTPAVSTLVAGEVCLEVGGTGGRQQAADAPPVSWHCTRSRGRDWS